MRVPFVASLLLMSVIASAPDSGAEVVINEFMASNDSTLVDGDGKSHISYEDFAVAMLDEIEDSKHSGQRFTVGY